MAQVEVTERCPYEVVRRCMVDNIHNIYVMTCMKEDMRLSL